MTLYVLDTNAVIDFFEHVFKAGDSLSPRTKNLIENTLNRSVDHTRLIIPSIVFIEIYKKWLVNEEFTRMFYHEVLYRILNCPYVEIKPIEREVIEQLSNISGSLAHHEIHDKLIVASALSLNCSIISKDEKIKEFVDDCSGIPHCIY